MAGTRTLARTLAVVVSVTTASVGFVAAPAAAAPNTDPGSGYAWGYDHFRQLGNGERFDAVMRTPTAVAGVTGVDQLVTSSQGTFAHNAGGWSGWGGGDSGEMCDGTANIRYSPAPTGIPATATNVVSRSPNVLFIDGGTVFGCGANSSFIFGNSTGEPQTTPIAVPELPAGDIVDLTAGRGSFFAVQTDGTVWGWGTNSNGLLGVGGTGNRAVPVQVEALAGVRKISTKQNHMLALKADGTVLAAGQNTSGQLGDGTITRRLSPVPVSGLTDVIEIATGDIFSMALRSDGTVWTWGSAIQGELGTGTPGNARTPQQVTGLPPVAHIATGETYAAVVTTGGDVYTWGTDVTVPNTLQLTAVPTPRAVAGLHGVAAIAAADHHIAALLTDQTVVAWGENRTGAIGTGELPPDDSPVLAAAPIVPPGDANIVDIQGGTVSAYARTASGGVLAWGLNGSNQLGNAVAGGTSVPTPVTGLSTGVTAIAAGFHNAFALTDTGAVMGWGPNAHGTLGDGTTEARTSPVAVTGLGGPATAVAAGDIHGLAAMADGTVRAWGTNNYGQLGYSPFIDHLSLSAVPVAGLSNIVGVAADNSASYAISATGELYTWGQTVDGSGGIETDYIPRLVAGLPPVKSVSVRNSTVAAIDVDGKIWTWGFNSSGQLGDGTTTARFTPQVVPLQSPAVAVSVNAHVVTLLADGSVWGWGLNQVGQLGLGTTTNEEPTPVQVPGLPPAVVAVSTGLYSTLAIAGVQRGNRVSIGSVRIDEGISGSKLATFPVTLSSPAATTVRVTYTTADGTATQPSDYLTKTGTVVFNPGVTAQTVTVRINGDVSEEPDETFTVRLTAVTTGPAVLGTATGTGTIANDDATSTVSVGPAQVTEGNSGSKLLAFPVTLSRPATSTIKATYATSNGTATAGQDYVAAAGTLAFLVGESSKTVSVKVSGDPMEEPDENLHLTLTGVTSGPAVLGTASADGLIVNDDVTAVVTITDAQIVEGNSGGQNLVFTVTLSQPVTGAVKISYATANGTALSGTDYTAKTGTVTFAAGGVTNTISVSVRGDRLVEPNETFQVTLTGVTQGPATIGPGSATGTIINND